MPHFLVQCMNAVACLILDVTGTYRRSLRLVGPIDFVVEAKVFIGFIHLTDIRRIASVVSQLLGISLAISLWQQQRVTHLDEVGQQFVLDIML